MERRRNSQGRFAKIKADTEDILDLCFLSLKLLIIGFVFYCIFTYFDAATKLKDIIANLVFKDCNISCGNSNGSSNSKNGYFN